ncbi:tetratricopeptide repeat protein [Paraburkholderia kururiensis]|uniref:tetratricopeptide repeat protein n=1 Tax=Paraburkholderia kururiensis TaxID=984307 RepID=UPI000E0B6BA9|nr:tetratricopeptide repeat protein [Paraburkholderia kururiensis]
MQARAALPAKRPRIAPLWLVLLLAGMVVLTFYATWPGGGLRERVATAPTSELSVAYLEAWLRVQPDNEEFLQLLGTQYREVGRLDDALRVAQRMARSQSPDMRRSALLLRLGIDEQKAFAYPEGSRKREEALEQVRDELHAAAAMQWDTDDLQHLASRAAATGTPALARDLYARLSQQDAAGRREWDRALARYAVETGSYREAADAYFRLQDSATTLDARRNAFLSGIRTLQSGNLLADALDAAQRHAGSLENDKATLIVLLNLARAAQRPDLVDRYAKALAKYAAVPLPSPEDAQRAARFAYMDGPVATPRGGMRGPAGLYAAALREGLGARIMRVAASAAAAAAPRISQASAGASSPAASAASASAPAAVSTAKPAASTNTNTNANANANASEDVASLVFTAFVESRDLDNAQKIAEQQVARHPDSGLWLKRLAQVAEWNHAPALALKTWLAYARTSNDADAWQTVRRMAPMLNDDEAYLDAMIHASAAAPADMNLVDAVTSTYERLGRPDDALAFLRAHPRDGAGDAIDERIATLAERAGHDDEALAVYRQLLARRPGNTLYAVRAASLLFRRSDFAGAYATLQKSHDAAKDDDVLYWRNYAQVARLLQKDGGANDAYRHLLAGGKESPDDLAAMTYFYSAWPLDAGRTAELQYRRDGTVRALQLALFNYTSARAWDRAAALLASLTPKEREQAEASVEFLTTRAEYERQTDHVEQALRDLERAVALPDATDDARAALLWTLVDDGNDAALKRARWRWCENAQQRPALWGPCAAAELRMDRPVAALRLLRLQSATMQRDPLWLLTYADAEEQAGRADLARSIRRHVWRRLQRENPAALAATGQVAKTGLLQDEDMREQLSGRRVTLAQTFERADVSLALLNDLIASDAGRDGKGQPQPEQRTLLGNTPGLLPLHPANTGGKAAGEPVDPQRLKSAVAKDVALAWALSQEANPLAKRWLAQQYANRLAQPADARLTLALADGDTATMEHLLDEEGGKLPVTSRIDASVAVDRPTDAEQLAFNALEGAPDNTDYQTRLTDTALAWPQSIDADVSNHIEHPLDYTELALSASRKLTGRYLVGVTSVQRFQHSADETQLVNVPAQDRSIGFYVERRTNDTSVTLAGGRREGLDSFYTANVEAEVGRNSPVTLTVRAGRNQNATESQALLVGGMKDNVAGTLLWNVTPRWYVSGNVEADRFYSQARNYLGSGVLTTGEIGYRIRTTYPDYTLRVVGTRGSYGASGGADALISRLLPATAGPATAATFVPQTYAQYGFFASVGGALREQYTHAWRPFAEVGLVHDSLQGWGPQLSAGVAGTVFGGDHAAVYVEYQRVSQLGTSVRVIGGRYSWFY